MEMGDDGFPHGVSTSSVAARVNPGREDIPVPPITAICTGATILVSENFVQIMMSRILTVKLVRNACHPAIWN